MKHIILLLAMTVSIAMGAQAQSDLSPSPDTLTNSATRSLTIKIPGTYNNALTFQLNVIKISGTTAGTAFVQGSLDGVNYFTLPGTDTLTMANSNNFKSWVVGKSNYLFYRIQVVGSNTQSTQLKGLVLYR